VLARSVKAGRPWQVLGNQVVMARVPGPSFDRLPAEQLASLTKSTVGPRLLAAQAAYKAGLPFNLDSWDGYPAARERLYASFVKAGANPLVLSGDSHAFWANALANVSGRPVASEFGTSAITSPSVGDAVPQLPIGRMLEDAGPEVLFCDQKAKGYILLSLTREQAVAEYRAVSTIIAKPYDVETIARYRVAASDRRLTRS